MENNSLWAILGSIVSAVIGAVLGAIFQWYRTRVRPQYLICEEIARTSLEVIEEAREETEIRYGGTRVDRLSLEKLRLFNHGAKVLKGADFTVRLNPEVKIVGIPPCKILPEGEGEIVFPWQEQPPNQNEKKFHVHYLNPFKLYEQEVIIDLICDGKITEVGVFGGGPGWSVKFWSLEEKKRIGARISRIFFASFLIAVGGVLGATALWGARIFWRIPGRAEHADAFAISIAVGLVLLGFAVAYLIALLARWKYVRRYGISL